MRGQNDESLFEHTKMTFGEHLEELRACLFRSLIGIFIGFLVGLAVAGQVVKWIERPLRLAMDDYYINRAETQIKTEFGQLPADVKKFMESEKMTYIEVRLETQQLVRAMQAASEWVASTDSLPPEEEAATAGNTPPATVPTAALTLGAGEVPIVEVPSTDMVRVRLWQGVASEIRSLNAYEPFMIWLKAATVVGLVLASPWVFYQIWAFVAAGLYPNERNYVYIYLPISLGLFLAGAALVFFAVFRPVLAFLLSFNNMMGIDPDPRISEWMSFVLLLPIAFGISFQLPLVMLFLERIGIVSIKAYVEKWRIAVLAIFFVAMIMTPADPISMVLMAAPLTLLYFGGLALCRWMPRRQSPFGPGYDPV